MSADDNAPLQDSPAFILGEIRGQMRELIHSSNNTAALVVALGVRVAKLEQAESKREGANNLITTITKSPALGWLVGAASVIWALATGKLNI